jgi:hypothetical protein
MKRIIPAFLLIILLAVICGCMASPKSNTHVYVSGDSDPEDLTTFALPPLGAVTPATNSMPGHIGTREYQKFLYDADTNMSVRGWWTGAGTPATNSMPGNINTREYQKFTYDQDTNVSVRVYIANWTNIVEALAGAASEGWSGYPATTDVNFAGWDATNGGIFTVASLYVTNTSRIVFKRDANDTMGFASQGFEPGADALSNSVFIGNSAGNSSAGDGNIYIGELAGSTANGSDTIAIGWHAGQNGPGVSNTVMGSYAGYNSAGDGLVALGAYSGFNLDGTNNIAIGYNAGQNADSELCIFIGKDATVVGDATNSIAIGYYARLANDQHDTVILGGDSITNTFLKGIVILNNNLLPDTDNAYSLGSADKQWAELHVAGGSIYLAGQRIGYTNTTGEVVLQATVIQQVSDGGAITNTVSNPDGTFAVGTNGVNYLSVSNGVVKIDASGLASSQYAFIITNSSGMPVFAVEEDGDVHFANSANCRQYQGVNQAASWRGAAGYQYNDDYGVLFGDGIDYTLKYEDDVAGGGPQFQFNSATHKLMWASDGTNRVDFLSALVTNDLYVLNNLFVGPLASPTNVMDAIASAGGEWTAWGGERIGYTSTNQAGPLVTIEGTANTFDSGTQFFALSNAAHGVFAYFDEAGDLYMQDTNNPQAQFYYDASKGNLALGTNLASTAFVFSTRPAVGRNWNEQIHTVHSSAGSLDWHLLGGGDNGTFVRLNFGKLADDNEGYITYHLGSAAGDREYEFVADGERWYMDTDGAFVIEDDSDGLVLGQGEDVEIQFDGSNLEFDSLGITANDKVMFNNFDDYIFDNEVWVTNSAALHVAGDITGHGDVNIPAGHLVYTINGTNWYEKIIDTPSGSNAVARWAEGSANTNVIYLTQ